MRGNKPSPDPAHPRHHSRIQVHRTPRKPSPSRPPTAPPQPCNLARMPANENGRNKPVEPPKPQSGKPLKIKALPQSTGEYQANIPILHDAKMRPKNALFSLKIHSLRCFSPASPGPAFALCRLPSRRTRPRMARTPRTRPLSTILRGKSRKMAFHAKKPCQTGFGRRPDAVGLRIRAASFTGNPAHANVRGLSVGVRRYRARRLRP